MLNDADLKSLEKLEEWEREYIRKRENNPIKDVLQKTGEFLEPITDPVKKRMKPIAENKSILRIQEAIKVAIAGAFQFTHDNIKYTYNKDYIIKCLKISSMDSLFDFNADEIEGHVRKIANQNKIAASLEGFGLGMGGLESTLIEIPIFFGLIARVQQQICACYGYDAESEFEQSYMLKALSFSDAVALSGKTELLMELNTLKVAIKKNTYKQLKEMGGKYTIPEIAKKFAQKQGIRLSKDKMIQAAPIIGGLVGGLFNYGYIHRVINVTNNLYKKRYLEDKKEMNSDIA